MYEIWYRAWCLDRRTCLLNKDIVEKQTVVEAPSKVVVLGRYIVSPEILDILAKSKPGKGGEIQLTDALKELALKKE